ncbi:protein FAR-RED IMPAIRED RESPONSE 1-like [Silene latifolia]|uniref:protein FAR-RED IMPAIRED RESPONSE 1-like n=1 Tax=Silene latifolia TaxID=37657 RepID=UPI003D78B2E5
MTTSTCDLDDLIIDYLTRDRDAYIDLVSPPHIRDDSLNKNGVQHDRQELCREVEKRFTPSIGHEFGGIEDAVTFYKIYAIACGFNLKIRATRTYEICNEHVNGFENIGASLNDFKNFHRDVKYFIHECDVSFDPTYSTNKYSMVFTPFSGVDQHKRSVTFCGALIAREDYESFNWELAAAEFVAIWEQIIEEHGLIANDWFADTYAIRGQWVMAHCRDLKMASVVRTTQRSESENSFFKRFEHKSGTLVEFWMHFESAMDQQRHTQKQLDNNDKHSSPKTSTHLALESHGAKVCTYSTFYTFKEEDIYSVDTCRTRGFIERDELEVTTVKDSSRGKNFEVANSPDYTRRGMKTIPDDYVVKRWTEECLRFRMFNCNGEGTDNMGFKDKPSPLGEVLNKNQQMEKILHCTASEGLGIGLMAAPLSNALGVTLSNKVTKLPSQSVRVTLS